MDNPQSPRRALGRTAAVLAAGLMLQAAAPARAQDYPSRPIRVIVPFGAGTSTDIMTRLVAARMSQSLGQQIVVEDRPGAGGTIGSLAVAKAAPDGYTLAMGSIASHSINMSLMPAIPYDVLRDFTAISLVTTAPNILVVHKSVPATNLVEFTAYAKAQKDGLSYASAGNGTSSHLAGELLKMLTQAPLTHVPYKSGSQAVNDVVSGQVPMLIYQIPAMLPHVEAGSVKALAATSAARLPQLPNVPTLGEQGIQVDVSAWMGLFGPAGMPAAVTERLHAEVAKALADPDLRQQLTVQGLEPVGMAPAAFRSFLDADIKKWAEVVKVSGAKVD